MKKTLILLTVLTCLSIIVGISMKSGGKKTSFKAGSNGPYQAPPTKEEGDVVRKDIEDLLRRTR